MSACCTCDYIWRTGSDGSHSCSTKMSQTIRELKLEQVRWGRRILAARDALAEDKDIDEAYHHLYAIASPEFADTEPWKDLEEMVANTPAELKDRYG